MLLNDDLDFDTGVTGFSIAEIDLLVEGPSPEDDGDPADDLLPAPNAVATRCRPGDIRKIGPRLVNCGDALDPETADLLMAGERARMVFTDPPYNVPIGGHVGGFGKVKHREFTMACGEMNASEVSAFLRNAFDNLTRHSHDGSIHFICMDWRHMAEILEAGGKS